MQELGEYPTSPPVAPVMKEGGEEGRGLTARLVGSETKQSKQFHPADSPIRVRGGTV